MSRIARAAKLTVALTCMGAGATGGWAAGATTYKWFDDQGVVHYGDTIPPQYAQKESTLLNKEGMPIGHKEATKTAAELAVAANAEEQIARQKQHDTFLLATYTSVKDIEQLRDERLLQIKGQ